MVRVLLVDCETVPTATHNTTLSPASRALECGRSGRGYPTHVPDPLPFWHMPPGAFFYVAPHMVSATESVQILPLRVPLTLLPSVSVGSAKNFRGGPTWARRRAVLQASFSRAHRCEALAMVLPAHYPVAVAHATAEHRAYLEYRKVTILYMYTCTLEPIFHRRRNRTIENEDRGRAIDGAPATRRGTYAHQGTGSGCARERLINWHGNGRSGKSA